METKNTRPVQNGFGFFESQDKPSRTSKSSPGWGALFRLEKEQIHLRHEIEIARLKDKLEKRRTDSFRELMIGVGCGIILTIGISVL